jgi:hypothetical protein
MKEKKGMTHEQNETKRGKEKNMVLFIFFYFVT